MKLIKSEDAAPAGRCYSILGLLWVRKPTLPAPGELSIGASRRHHLALDPSKWQRLNARARCGGKMRPVRFSVAGWDILW